ncbi:hypothetical protein ACFX11_034961 [Malus domestica]
MNGPDNVGYTVELPGVPDDVAEKLGFEKISEEFIGDCDSNAVLFRHKKTGAQVMSLSNGARQKVFGIAFQTIPTDSTGVASILHHSVLCGSRNYPVKKPFDELENGSFSTILDSQAMADKTYYSGACTTTKELYNLIDVILDAVFFPKCVEDVQIFQEQGWHYELNDPSGDISYQGVVFNKMKEFYSRPGPDNVLRQAAWQGLFPDSTYGFDCAGDPNIIPQLTFENFKEFHRKNYHPSNAKIWFYGDDDPTERLHILSEYLDMYDASSAPNVSRVKPQRLFSESVRILKNYPSDKSGDLEKENVVCLSWMLCDKPLDTETEQTIDVLVYFMMGNLTRILQEYGYHVYIEIVHLLQPVFRIAVFNVSCDDILKVELFVTSILVVFVEEGFDTHYVEASITAMELFILRGGLKKSRGLTLMLLSLDKWIHEMKPFEPLKFGKSLMELNARIQKEGSKAVLSPVIEKFIVKNPHKVVVAMRPDPQKVSSDEKAEKEILRKVKVGMREEDLAELARATQELQLKQKTPDPPEALRSVPSLSLLDLPKEPIHVPTEVAYVNGVKVLQHELFTNDVLYTEIVFNMGSLKQELLPLVPIFCFTLLKMDTKDMSSEELRHLISRKTGGLTIDPMILSVRCKKDPCGHVVVGGKVMAGRAEDLFELIKIVLQEVQFTDKRRFKKIVSQFIVKYEETANYHEIAAARMEAKLNISGWIREQLFGISQLEFLQVLGEKVDQDWDGISSSLEEIRKSIICKKGCLINMISERKNLTKSEKFIKKLLDLLPHKSPFARRTTWKGRLPSENEAIIMPIKVNYVGKSVNIHDTGYQLNGSTHVISKFIDDAWLCDRVGISGGASASCYFDIYTGVFSFLSDGDPKLLKTLDVYDGTGDFLRQLEIDDSTLRRAIIQALRDDSCPLRDGKSCSSFLEDYLMGVTEEERQKRHKEILSTSLKDFKKFADALDAVKYKGVVVAVGSPLDIKAAVKKRPKLFKQLKAPLFTR